MSFDCPGIPPLTPPWKIEIKALWDLDTLSFDCPGIPPSPKEKGCSWECVKTNRCIPQGYRFVCTCLHQMYMPQGVHYKESAQDPHILLHKDPKGRNLSPKQCVILSFQAHTKLKLVKGTQRIMAIKTELHEWVLRFMFQCNLQGLPTTLPKVSVCMHPVPFPQDLSYLLYKPSNSSFWHNTCCTWG